MQTTTLLFGIHCHQPVDNFDWAVFEAIERSYLPFFETVRPYKQFRFSVHFSGWLLEKIAEATPQLFTLMKELASEGRIEFLSGGYYEPVLASIPSKDRVDQINMLNAYIETHFGQTPTGVWLTERVWDDGIMNDLRQCGITYTLVDDYHFIRSGFERSACNGYYTSENGGEPLAIFPISKPLRYAIPFETAEHAVEVVKETDTAIIFDDGEKFGLWPKTHEWVYEQGWLEDFLQRLHDDEAIECELYGNYVQNERSKGLAYLSNVSYFEMGEWALNANAGGAIKRLKAMLEKTPLASQAEMTLGGGIWKNFFVKYRESNHIHKRMLMLSQLHGELDSSTFDDLLFRAQTNDVLWHGVFGGLYLPNLRDNAYRYIIAAQAYASEALGYDALCEDFDGDGYEEVLLRNKEQTLIFSSKNGAQLCEWDLMQARFNLQNTLKRRKELYHDDLLNPPKHHKEASGEGIDTIHTAGLQLSEEEKEALVFDWYERGSFIDHFSDERFNLHNFYHADFSERGDFANQPFEILSFTNSDVTLQRHGGIYINGKSDTTLTKHFTLKPDGLEFDVEVQSTYDGALYYVCELNLHFAELSKVTCDERPLDEAFVVEAQNSLSIEDPYLNTVMTLSLDQPCTFYLQPISTVSQSEKGVDLTQQGVAIAIRVPMQKRLQLNGSIRFKECE